jgi:hypothetical protein
MYVEPFKLGLYKRTLEPYSLTVSMAAKQQPLFRALTDLGSNARNAPSPIRILEIP